MYISSFSSSDWNSLYVSATRIGYNTRRITVKLELFESKQWSSCSQLVMALNQLDNKLHTVAPSDYLCDALKNGRTYENGYMSVSQDMMIITVGFFDVIFLLQHLNDSSESKTPST